MTLKRELKKLKRQIKKLRKQVGELSSEQTEIGAIGFYVDDEIYDASPLFFPASVRPSLPLAKYLTRQKRYLPAR